MAEDRVRALAELAVKVGANVGDGQYLLVFGLVEHAPLVREIADVAYGTARAMSTCPTSTSTCGAR